MKELSIEQKAQRYDEAYKKVAMRFGTNVADEIFPELAESEDERIRKTLLKMFNHYVKNNIELTEYGLDKNKVLAWLEKQGQVKESDISQHENKTCKENSNLLTCEDEKMRKAIKLMYSFLPNKPAYINDVPVKEIFAWLEKQSEPTAWSEEDEVKVNRIVGCLENLNVADNDILLKDVDWLKSLKDRVKSQNHWKPSEGQIKICKEVYSDLLSAKGYDTGSIVGELNRLEEQLKKLTK